MQISTLEQYLNLLIEIRNELAEIDQEYYNSIMSLGYAKGYDEVRLEDTSPQADITKPEQYMIYCRKSNDELIACIKSLIDNKK